MNKSRTKRFTPLLVSLGVVVGILLGSFYANQFSDTRLSILNTSSDKLNSLLHIIDDQYVDSVAIPDLVERALPQILRELDPHSVYITAQQAEQSMQELKGSFSGIGVQFTIYKDTVRVVRVIEGGPSDGVGLKAGDRIVSIDGKPFVGAGITNDSTQHRLKGKDGSVVRLGVMRAGGRGVQQFAVTRGNVPIKSVDAVFFAAPTTGYIRITSFGDTTYAEFLAALATLSTQHFRNLIIDLRGNLGGYMAPAVQIANEFLPKNRLIVYTEGRKSPREEFRSDGRGSYQTMPLVVLVDESSASASEIFAGAVQDNDRGTVVGRRSFGKGLVQIPIEFNDGSMLRLTKARYYTPSGRCVQKPYTPGDEEEYEQDLIVRAERGEYFSLDSIRTSGEAYHTRLGRTVYGGGGIIPDCFIPRDTTGMTSYFKEAYLSGLIYRFAYDYVDANRARLSRINSLKELTKYLSKQGIVNRFAEFAARNGLKRRERMLHRSRSVFEEYLFAGIIDDLLGTEQATRFAAESDPAVQTALKLFDEGKAFPEKPAAQSKSRKK